MDAATGLAIDGAAHLAQSIADILFTPLGSRVLRRDYGSHLVQLLDAPLNRTTTVRLYAAVATALQRWEPRLKLRRVQLLLGASAGAAVLQLEGLRTDVPTPGALTRITLPLAGGFAALLSA